MPGCALTGAILQSWANTIHISGISRGLETVMASISKDEYKDIKFSQEDVLIHRARAHGVCFWLFKPDMEY